FTIYESRTLLFGAVQFRGESERCTVVDRFLDKCESFRFIFCVGREPRRLADKLTDRDGLTVLHPFIYMQPGIFLRRQIHIYRIIHCEKTVFCHLEYDACSKHLRHTRNAELLIRFKIAGSRSDNFVTLLDMKYRAV